MDRLLLDTTFLIDADRTGDDLDGAIDDDDDVAIAAITVAELRVGVLPADDVHRRDRARFLNDVVETVPVIDYDENVAEAHAQLLTQIRRQGRPREPHDLLIAATGRQSRRTIVSADTSAFAGLEGVTVRRHDGGT